MQYFKSIMPPKLGNVVDCRNIPINTEAVAYENRIKKIFIKFFGDGMIEKEAYWKLLWNMVNDPYKLYGIVGIDGFANDMSAKNDYGFYLNFGKPRLRARKYHNLKRIYGFIVKSGDLSFFNSKIETKDDQHFMMNRGREYNLWAADHPHISSSTPCLGAYQNDLVKWKHESNPIMYLKTINQFLNTWNSRSAYHNINHVQMVYTLNKDKPRVFSRGTYLMYNTSMGSRYNNTMRSYVNKHIFNIKSEDRQSELKILNDSKTMLNNIRESLQRDNSSLQGSKHSNYINMFIDVTGTPINSPSRDINWELINHGFSGRGRNLIDRYVSIKDGHVRFPQIPSAKTTYGILNDDEYYNTLHVHTNSLSKTIKECIKACIADDIILQVIDKYESFSIQKYIENIVPIIIEKNQVYADLTVKHSLLFRVNDEGTIDGDNNKEIAKIRNSLVRKYKLATTKLFKEIHQTIKDECDNLNVDEMLDKSTKTAFNYRVDDDDKKYLYSLGCYYEYASIHTVEQQKAHEKVLKINKWPTNFKELIQLYENSKKEAHLLFLEAEEKTLNYKKRKVIETYGYNISNTKQDSTQVPLSFETIS